MILKVFSPGENGEIIVNLGFKLSHLCRNMIFQENSHFSQKCKLAKIAENSGHV
jgi:hypothetical protein